MAFVWFLSYLAPFLMGGLAYHAYLQRVKTKTDAENLEHVRTILSTPAKEPETTESGPILS